MADHAPASGPGSRKRGRDHAGGLAGPSSVERPAKHVKRGRKLPDAIIKHALLAHYYSEIQTLRQYALSELPPSSRIRRKKIASVGLGHLYPDKSPTEDELALGELLDKTIVGRRRQRAEDGHDHDHRWRQWVGFSQKGDESNVTLSDGLKGSIYSQSEIVDFVVWLLFSREGTGSWPKHALCDGFRKQTGQSNKSNPTAASTIPGLYSVYPNQHVQALKQAPWPQLLMLLGKEGERIMIDLLVDCAIFRSVRAGKGNLYQMGGTRISELETLTQAKASNNAPPVGVGQRDAGLRPSEISFARNRMLYARAALNARGIVQFGLRHIHVLNRFPYKVPPTAQPDQNHQNVIHIMMYLFPRQFGLHNVFTSAVDRRQTAQKLQDYTLREEEIAAKYPLLEPQKKPVKHVPRRLRGKTVELVQRLQVLHSRCSYTEMLRHYCPVLGQANCQKTTQTTSGPVLPQSSRPSNKSKRAAKGPKPPATPLVNVQYSSLTELATPSANVSAFCQAVISRVIPNEFWGQGSIQEHNKTCFLKKVHHFVCLRRFESMYLHEMMQGMKINDIEWLTPPGLGGQKSSQSDTRKRTEIFYELLYYLIDSLLIPLIRSNFYVTESNVDRYRLFFFRHDVWRYVAEPALAVLKTTMFEEVRMEDARQILQSRRLGYSQVRLLPKQMKMRPIMNLRRRTLLQGNKKLLGPSINTILGPVSSVLKLEKTLNPNRLGASLFSVGDVYQRIKAFKTKLGGGQHKFYFAKIDVQAAFDTIPQNAMIELLKQILRQSHYKLLKHAEVALPPSSTTTSSNGATDAKPTRRWHTTATTSTDARPFPQRLEEDAGLRKNKTDTVFVHNAAQATHAARDLLALATAHVRQNLVRVGKKYYRQKEGIPQGSVLSSTLCNYFYADLERRCLPFLVSAEDDCLLMRLIDDFLLITTDRDKARRFVEVMHGGLPEYGVVVNAAKSLANFGLVVGGVEVPRLGEGGRFPYCGLLIDCATLAVAKGREGMREGGIFNSLTVEYSRCPGKNFKRKVLNTFKIQSHLMFFDTSHNSRREVLMNIYSAFVETATKMWAYARCLASRPGTAVLIDTIKALIDVAFVLLTSRVRRERYPGYVCGIRKEEIAWLAMVACRQVLVRKQAGYRDVIAWLEEETRKRSSQKGLDVEVLVGVAKDGLVYRRAADGKGLRVGKEH